MATIAYLTAKGQRQGDIKGNVTEKGREGSIALSAVSYEIDTPFDPASGRPSGKRQHKPVTIAKAVDQSTPKLLQAVATNETLTTARIEFWRATPESAGPYFVIALTNAAIVEARLAPSADREHGETGRFQEYEEIAMTYQKIEWTWVQGGVTAQDDWNAPT